MADRVHGVFEALGEPRRRAILALLADGEQPAGAIVDALQAMAPTTQPTVSQHLKVLREAGLVTVRAEGTRRLYSVDPQGVAVAQAWLQAVAEHAHPFDQALDALATEVARGKRQHPTAPTAATSAPEASDGKGSDRKDRPA